MKSIQIKRIQMDEPAYTAMVILRDEVLRQPLGLSIYNDDLSRDEEDIKLVAVQDEQIVGCLMLKKIGTNMLKLRAMAVSQKIQTSGIGRQLVAAAEQIAWAEGYETIQLHAREAAIGFYEKQGYHTVGELFTEVGIPHKLMQKDRA